MDTLYIVIPAYNEKENIEEVVNSWYPYVENRNNTSRLVIVNDGSKDNTLDLLREMQKTHPKLEVLDKNNGGHGSAVIAGYKYALDNGADYIFQTDSDLQTLPAEFVSFWNVRGKFDAAFGKRNKRGDGFVRFIVEKIVCIMLFMFFGVKIPDANCPFRIYKNIYLKEYLSYMDSEYMIPNIMLTTFYAYYERNICYIPVTFNARQKGKQTINIRKILGIGVKSLKDFSSYRRLLKNEKR